MTLAPDQNQTPRPAWGIWATIGWSLLSFLASGATTLIVAMAWFGGEPSVFNLYSDLILILGLLVSTPVGILVLVAAARRRGWAAMDYFALNTPRRGEIVWSAEMYRIFECGPELKPTPELVLSRTHPADRAAVAYLLQNAEGQIQEAHSISAGLDYPGIGPEHSWLKEQGRVEYVSATDNEALDAFQLLCKLEGIIPALEPAHALAHVTKLAPTLPKDNLLVMNLCGRGDKDVFAVAERLGMKI